MGKMKEIAEMERESDSWNPGYTHEELDELYEKYVANQMYEKGLRGA